MTILQNLLKAKESRHNIKINFTQQKLAIVSLNFNIPGHPKTDDLLKECFEIICHELKLYLKAIRVNFEEKKVLKQIDTAGDICFFPFNERGYDLQQLKEKLEFFEESHYLGRILDIDLFSSEQKVISSNKQKKCLICDKPAIYCMREKNHTYQELRAYINKKIIKYVTKNKTNNIYNQLSTIAIWAILTEVSLLNKPGLVSPNSDGSHTDMNYHTFLASTSSISNYFKKIAKMGYQWNGKKTQNIITKLRVIGLQMEEDMLLNTHGINTQKGIIFLIIFCLFVSSYTIKKDNYFNTKTFKNSLKSLNQDLVNIELDSLSNQNRSHGEQCFKIFGKNLAGGIRQEVEHGLPTFFDIVYPFMQRISFNKINYNTNKEEFEEKCLKILIKIMSINNDTNILFRSDKKTLESLKTKALNTLNNNEPLSQNSDYKSLINFCKQKNISPGGSADLLAVSLFLNRVINIYR